MATESLETTVSTVIQSARKSGTKPETHVDNDHIVVKRVIAWSAANPYLSSGEEAEQQEIRETC